MMMPGAVPPVWGRAHAAVACASCAAVRRVHVAVWTLVGVALYALYRESEPSTTLTPATARRGVPDGYYPITPKGRDEGDEFQTWLRRHGAYERQ